MPPTRQRPSVQQRIARLLRGVLLAAVLLGCSSCDWVRDKLVERRLQIGTKKLATNNYAGAIKDFSDVIRLQPHNANAYIWRAACEYSLKNFGAAINDYTAAMQWDTHDARPWLGRGTARLQLRRLPEALADLNRSIELESYDSRAYFARGYVRELLQDREGAAKDYDKAIEVNPQAPEGYLGRAHFEARQHKLEKALEDADLAVSLNYTNVTAYTVRAHVKQMLKEYPEALADANMAVKLGPDQSEAYTIRAGIKLSMHDFQGAEEDVRQALKLNPANATALSMQGMSKKKQGDLRGALADLTLATHTGPPQGPIYHNLGCVQSDLFQSPEALESFHKAVEADSTQDYSRYRIWLLRTRLGQREEATRDLEAYLVTLKGDKAQNWSASIYEFLAGHISEADFLSQASARAERPSDEAGQICESYYYAAMKRLLNNDASGAKELLQKCLDTKQDNYTEFASAHAELAKMQ